MWQKASRWSDKIAEQVNGAHGAALLFLGFIGGICCVMVGILAVFIAFVWWFLVSLLVIVGAYLFMMPIAAVDSVAEYVGNERRRHLMKRLDEDVNNYRDEFDSPDDVWKGRKLDPPNKK